MVYQQALQFILMHALIERWFLDSYIREPLIQRDDVIALATNRFSAIVRNTLPWRHGSNIISSGHALELGKGEGASGEFPAALPR